jgi:predicted nucleic acid-binding protein
MSAVVYDASVLIAADRNDARVWHEHRARLAIANIPLVPSAVVAQVSRSPHQVQLRRFLRGCKVIPLLEDDAHAVGRLLGAAGTSDVVDGCVVALAVARGGGVVTSDRDDIERLVGASGSVVPILDA